MTPILIWAAPVFRPKVWPEQSGIDVAYARFAEFGLRKPDNTH